GRDTLDGSISRGALAPPARRRARAPAPRSHPSNPSRRSKPSQPAVVGGVESRAARGFAGPPPPLFRRGPRRTEATERRSGRFRAPAWETGAPAPSFAAVESVSAARQPR